MGWLRDGGADVQLLCTPDQRPDCTWSVDWLVRVDGQPWLIEHMSLTYSHRSIPRLRSVDRILGPFLEGEGRRRSVRIGVFVSPRIDSLNPDKRVARREFRASIEALQDFISTSLDSIELGDARASWDFEDSRGNTLQVQPLDPGLDHAAIGYWVTGSTMSSSPDLRGQFDLDIAPTIRRKLREQIRKVPGLVESAGLILDQVDTDAGVVNYLLSPDGVRQALVDICTEFPGSLDRAWMLTRDGAICELALR